MSVADAVQLLLRDRALALLLGANATCFVAWHSAPLLTAVKSLYRWLRPPATVTAGRGTGRDASLAASTATQRRRRAAASRHDDDAYRYRDGDGFADSSSALTDDAAESAHERWMATHFTVSGASTFASSSRVSGWKRLRQQRLWTLLTACISQRDWAHLASNAGALVLFGGRLSRVIGGPRLVVLYALSGVLSNCAFVATAPTRWTRGLGASGSVAALITCYCVLRPTRYLSFGGGARAPAVVFACAYVLAELASARAAPNDGIAHSAHWSGAVVGAVYASYLLWAHGYSVPKVWRALLQVVERHSDLLRQLFFALTGFNPYNGVYVI